MRPAQAPAAAAVLCGLAATTGHTREAPSIEGLRAAVAAQQRTLDDQAIRLDQQRQEIVELRRRIEATTPSPSDGTPGAVTPLARLKPPADPLLETGEPDRFKPSLDLAGYVQTDALYAPGARPGEAEDLFLPRLIGAPGAPRRDRLRLSARDTRLSVDARWPGPALPLRAYVEFDFFGQAPEDAQAQLSSYAPRLRHALVEIGPGTGAWTLTIGQTWSAFADPAAYGPFYNASPFGAVFVRQAQVRYTRWLRDDTRVFLSVENPQGEAETPVGSGGAHRFDDAPDIAGGLRLDRSWGHLQVAGLLRSIQHPATEDRARGWGLAVSGGVRPHHAPKGRLRAQVSGGEGMGRYVSDLGPGFDATIAAGGDLHPRRALAATASYEHAWSDRWRSALGVSLVDVEASRAGDLRRSRVITGNTVFRPVEALDLAAEVTLGDKTVAGGRSTRASLYRLTSRLSF
jgi:hypothetical protein